MRIDDILSQSIDTRNLKNSRKQVQPAALATAETRRDTVTISQAARDAQKSGVNLAQAARKAQQQQGGAGFTTPKTGADNPLKEGFKAYMDKILNRGVIGGAKSPKERMEELTEKLKALKTQLGEVASDTSLPENVKKSRMDAINSQIKAMQEQIDQLGKEIMAAAAEQPAA